MKKFLIDNKKNILLVTIVVVLIAFIGLMIMYSTVLDGSAFADTYTYDVNDLTTTNVLSGVDMLQFNSSYNTYLYFSYPSSSSLYEYQQELIDLMCSLSRSNNFTPFRLVVDVSESSGATIASDCDTIVELANVSGLTYTTNDIDVLIGSAEFGTSMVYNLKSYLVDYVMDKYASDLTIGMSNNGYFSVAIYGLNDTCYYRSNSEYYEYTFAASHSDLNIVSPDATYAYAVGGLYLDSTFTTPVTTPSTLASGTTVYIGALYYTRTLYFYVNDELDYTLNVQNGTNFNTLSLSFLTSVEGYEYSDWTNVTKYYTDSYTGEEMGPASPVSNFDETNYVITNSMFFYCTLDRIVCTINFYIDGVLYEAMDVYYGSYLGDTTLVADDTYVDYIFN